MLATSADSYQFDVVATTVSLARLATSKLTSEEITRARELFPFDASRGEQACAVRQNRERSSDEGGERPRDAGDEHHDDPRECREQERPNQPPTQDPGREQRQP